MNELKRLNIGCGDRPVKGAVNIDIRAASAADEICDARKLWIVGTKELFDVVESYDLIQYVHGTEAHGMFKEWFRVLKPGGRLIIECPHFGELLVFWLRGSGDKLWPVTHDFLMILFGKNRFADDTVKWGWTPQSLTRILADVGFINIKQMEPTDNPRLGEPRFRIEANKP